ncbi:glycosyltransferase [Limnobacter sp.]|uniref:glycosyltransferase n=1 Tax=Limnobacter sp. TaxID=2003368 RepID=UPI0027B946F1|nr:glycosyltransferase [Limnobacter sp.]
MKVYLSGASLGSYRAQNIMKSLLDNKIDIVYLPQLYFRQSISYRSLRLLSHAVFAALTVPIRFIAIACSTHLLVLPMNAGVVTFIEILIARLMNKQVVLDFYLSQYDTSVNDRKTVDKNSFNAKLAYIKDRFLLKISTKIIFLNWAEASYYHEVVGKEIEEKKIHILPLCVDYKKEMIGQRRHESKDSFIICWWGTYIPLHGLEVVFEALSIINRMDIKMKVYGDCDKKTIPYMKLVESLNLNDVVTFDNSCTFNNGRLAPRLVNECDLALGNFGSSKKSTTVLVNKVVDALSLGLPCLTIRTLASMELLTDEKGVIYCDGNANSIAKEILVCVNNKSYIKEKGFAGREIFLEKFSYEVFSEKLIKILR